MDKDVEYIPCIIYTMMPSRSLYKLSSIVRLENVIDIIQIETFCVIYPSLETIIYSKDLFKFFNTTDDVKEIIMGIKKYKNFYIKIKEYDNNYRSS